MSAPNPPPPPDQPGGGNPGGGNQPPLFSMNFFVPLNPNTPGAPPTGQPQGTMTWTMSFSTQPPPGHPAAPPPPGAAGAAAVPPTNIPPVGLNFTPTPIPAVGMPGMPPMFPPFNFPAFFGAAEAPPDPEKAKELLRSLPTVSEDMLERINRLCDADEPDAEVKGWQCGICMEGTEEGRIEEDGTGVKALPCNHLFHEACLEPWFATKHTCPACRLDLDPLHTLGSSSATSAGRAARPPRAGFHPFRRDAMPPSRQAPASAPASATVNAFAPPPVADASNTDPDELVDVETSFSFTFRIPTPPAPDSEGPTAAGEQPPQQPIMNPLPIPFNLPIPPFLSPNGTPNGMLGSRIHTSPSPTAPTRQATPPPPMTVPFIIPPPTANGPAMQFPSLNPTAGVNGSMPFPIFPFGGVPPSQAGAGAPAGAPGAPPIHAPQPRRPQVVVHHNHPPPPPGLPMPPFVPANFHPPMVAPTIIHVFHGGPPERPSAPAPPAKAAFVPKPLEDWVKERERAKGWRHDCDAPSCEFDSGTRQGDASSLDTAAAESALGKEPPLEALFAPPTPGSGDEEKKSKGGGEKPACAHRYHAGCLETMERSAGRWNVQDDGKVFVRCARCRKDGWVHARDAEEEEVERGLVEA